MEFSQKQVKNAQVSLRAWNVASYLCQNLNLRKSFEISSFPAIIVPEDNLKSI